MKSLKVLAAAIICASPLFLSSAPAQAITANQFQAQGHGRYVSSNHRGGWRGYHRWHRHHGWRRHYHRHYR